VPITPQLEKFFQNQIEFQSVLTLNRKKPMKNVLTLAALLGLVGAAQAQVTVYGLIDVGYGTNKTDVDGGSTAYDAIHFGTGSQGNSTSKIGFKGASDVGSGIKANFQLEGGIARDGGKVGFDRQMWAGLSGSFGEVRAGRQDSVLFQSLAGFDDNGAANDTFVGNNNGVPIAGRFTTQLAQYISPSFSGLTVRAGFTPEGNFKDNTTADTTLATKGNKAILALAANYSAGPISAALAYESKGNSDGKDLVVVGGSYDLGVAKFNAIYAAGGDNAKGYKFGVSAPVAGVTIGAAYSQNTDTKDSGTEFFANKEVLKNTYAYLDIGTFHRDTAVAEGVTKNKGDYQIYSVGMMFVF
jgi:predicted porin